MIMDIVDVECLCCGYSFLDFIDTESPVPSFCKTDCAEEYYSKEIILQRRRENAIKEIFE